MNILVSTEYYHKVDGGAEQMFRAIVDALFSRGHKVIIVSFEGKQKAYPCNECLQRGIIHIDYNSRLAPLDFSFSALRDRTLHRIISNVGGLNVIFTQHYYSQNSFWAARLARELKAPLVVKPIGIYRTDSSIYSLAYKMLELLQGRYVIRTASLILPTTQYEKAQMEKLGVPSEKVRVVRVGTQMETVLDDAEMQAFLKLANGRPSILYVGQVNSMKGADILLDAMKIVKSQVPELECVMAGENTSGFESRPEDSVKMLGRVEYGSMPYLYTVADVLVMPSLSEVSPLTLFEARQFGLPVIASNVGGMSEFVNDGQDGILVPPGDSKALADTIVMLFKNRKILERLAEGSLAIAPSSRRSRVEYGNEMVKALESVVR